MASDEKLDLDALEALERKATEAPWEAFQCDYCKRTDPESACGYLDGCSLDASYDECHHTLDLADAELIASLRNHARALIAEARRVRDLEKYAKHADGCAHTWHRCTCGLSALLRKDGERG